MDPKQGMWIDCKGFFCICFAPCLLGVASCSRRTRFTADIWSMRSCGHVCGSGRPPFQVACSNCKPAWLAWLKWGEVPVGLSFHVGQQGLPACLPSVYVFTCVCFFLTGERVQVKETKLCYGTSSLEHPGTSMIAWERGRYYLGGKLHGLELPKRCGEIVGSRAEECLPELGHEGDRTETRLLKLSLQWFIR